MIFENKTPKNVINKIYYHLPIEKKSFDKFVTELINFRNQINTEQTEEHNKNILRDFLIKTFYRDYSVNSFGEIDLAIKQASEGEPLEVIFEVKNPLNSSEMISPEDFNRRSFHEALLYYLREKIDKNNHYLKHIIITNCLQWYVFGASSFEQVFFRNTELVKNFIDWKNNRYDSSTTGFFYENIAKRFIDTSDGTLPYVLLNFETIPQNLSLEEAYNRIELIELYKFLSPVHLLRRPFANDNNSLNREFYDELLHILGLQEVHGENITIKRLPPEKRKTGYLIENTIERLYSRCNFHRSDEDAFEIALELVLTWLNRILFLKLLEARLNANKPPEDSFFFLNTDVIKDFYSLYILFFDVLAVPVSKRNPEVHQRFERVPFLNSSLFEITSTERDYFTINELNSTLSIPYFSRTVLKDEAGNRLTGNVNTLAYLLNFLNAYNFGSVQESSVQESPKSLINAAVLGLIFEKVNGYRDGSFFTPGEITMFMARSAIRTRLLHLFNQRYNWNADNFEDLPNYIQRNLNRAKILEYNQICDSIRICDPAVGSGHFLVSCLNELIACKSELGILADSNGYTLKIKAINENDELLLYDDSDNIFKYDPNNSSSRHIQKTIFHEKLNIIENCLFGVDINPKSVYITRLRLWIELLKNAYHHDDGNLETLPNIDLNIKDGDSLLSRFHLDDTSVSLYSAQLIEDYKKKVKAYKSTTDKKARSKLLVEIENIKNLLKGNIIQKSSLYLKRSELKEKLQSITDVNSLFELPSEEKQKTKQLIQKLEADIQDIEEKIKAEEQRYQNCKTFEWRLEFPEVLDEEGNFLGFDIVIGNPPYIPLQKDGGRLANLYQGENYKTHARTSDIYALFYERGMQLLKPEGLLCFVTSNKWMRAGYGEKLRKFFTAYNPLLLVDLGPGVFEHATVDTCILMVQKKSIQPPPQTITELSETSPEAPYSLRAVTIVREGKKPLEINKQLAERGVLLRRLSSEAWFIASEAEYRLKEKIRRIGKPLKDWDVKIYRGILTGLNEAFIITTEKRNEILANCRDEAERQRTEAIIKPILRGRDIKRYYYEWAGLWVIFIPWHFPLHKDTSIQGAS